MKYGKITFNQIFDKLNEDKFSFDKGELYIPEDLEYYEDLKLDTVLYFGEHHIIDDETDEEFVPLKIKTLGFDFGYNGQYLMDVYDNLIHYKAFVSSEDFLEAFIYYIEEDTFIDVKESDLRKFYDPNKTRINFISELPNGLKDLLKIKKIFAISNSISDLKTKYLEEKSLEIEPTLYESKMNLKKLEPEIINCIELKN